jgi:hypothetical protein
MMGLGAMLLMFCWFGFNLGSAPSAAAMSVDLPLVAINTLMAMSGGIVGSMLVSWTRGRPSAVITPNGALAGAVAICSGVHLVHPLFGFLVGAIAGAQIPFTSKWIAERLRIDDPCDVGPVHALPGLLGGVAAGVWAPMMPNGFHGHLHGRAIAGQAPRFNARSSRVAAFWIIDRAMGLRVTREESSWARTPRDVSRIRFHAGPAVRRAGEDSRRRRDTPARPLNAHRCLLGWRWGQPPNTNRNRKLVLPRCRPVTWSVMTHDSAALVRSRGGSDQHPDLHAPLGTYPQVARLPCRSDLLENLPVSKTGASSSSGHRRRSPRGLHRHQRAEEISLAPRARAATAAGVPAS